MAIDNKTIETKKQAKFFLLVVKRDGVKKYIDKKYYSLKHIDCTVIITKAKRFSTEIAALNFYKEVLDNTDSDVEFVAIVPLKIEYSIDL
ncbi:MAG: hypothetical protein ACREV6_22145 [Clostridium sp.]|uniref:hypothetical protein n=1 Tax=Clostridium sp. TaxID=1506 RepID=UPI003D6D915B